MKKKIKYSEYFWVLLVPFAFSETLRSFVKDHWVLVLFSVAFLVGWYEDKYGDSKQVKICRKNLEKNSFQVPFTDSFATVLNKMGFESHKELNYKVSENIAALWEKMGYKIEPDVRAYGRKRYKLDEIVCIYKDEADLPLTGQYDIAEMFAELGCKIMGAKSVSSAEERKVIENILTRAFRLNASEQLRLQKKLTLPFYGAKSVNVLMQHLIYAVGEDNRDFICEFIIAVSASDGVVRAKEQIFLKKIFKQLGLTSEYLMDLLSDLINKKGITLEKGVLKVPLKKPVLLKRSSEFHLDMDKLSNVMLDTANIHETLQEIFADEKDTTAPLETNNGSLGDGFYKDGQEQTELIEFVETGAAEEEDSWHSYAQVLLTQTEWTKADLLKILQKNGQMVSSFVDDLNEWAEEVYGDFLLLEEGDVYELNEDVAALIESEEKGNSNEFEE